MDHNLIDDEDYATEVYEALEKLKEKYNLIAIYFGLYPGLVEEIRHNNWKDNAGALKDIIIEWMRRNYSFEKFGHPCWRKVVEAAIGAENIVQAKEIAKSHPGKN